MRKMRALDVLDAMVKPRYSKGELDLLVLRATFLTERTRSSLIRDMVLYGMLELDDKGYYTKSKTYSRGL